MIAWASEEETRLRSLYPKASWPELEEAFPQRTRRALWNRAFRLGLEREQRDYAPGVREAYAARGRTGNRRRSKFLRPVEVREGVEGKVCVGPCGAWRPLARFARHRDCAGGRRAICTTCEGRVAYKRDPEARKKAVRAYQARKPEEHRTRKRAADRRRHGRKIAGSGVSAAFVRSLLQLPCAYCGGRGGTVDHVVPLARGGLHEASNLASACASCNFAKHTRTGEEFRAARGKEGT